jgi:hypothetical protein
MKKETAIKVFETKKVRSHWNEAEEKWYFSITDIIRILTDSIDSLAYWRKLKERLKKEGNETVTNCHGLKMEAADGKMRFTDVADTDEAKGLIENANAGKKGGTIAKNARLALEEKTGKKVVSSENFLPPPRKKKKLRKK